MYMKLPLLIPALCTALTGIISAAINDNDLDACWIRRYPVMEYVWNSSQPDVDGWPTNNQPVTWRATVKNWMTNDVTAPYRWYLDGSVVATGTVELISGVYTSVDLSWSWTFNRHELMFEIDAGNTIEEFSELNNRVSVYTDSISIGLWVEQSLYDYFHANQYKLAIGANSWEDWAQRHVDRWNQMFEAARFTGDAPFGVLDRIRLDNITIVEDDALPLNGGLPTNNPDSTNRTIDLQWGFTEGHIPMYNRHTEISDTNPFYFEDSLMHELGHARYLIDTYGLNVHDNPSYDPPQGTVWSNIEITVDGNLIVGTPYIPIRPPWADSVYFPTEFGMPGYGLMSGPKNIVDHYSAMAMNLIAGHRATRGNMNAPGNIGVYIQNLPAENRMLLLDNAGNPLSNAVVKVYQSGYLPTWYGKKYDDIPDLILTSDYQGCILLGRCPFDTDGTVNHGYGRANGVPIVRVEKDGKTGFGFFTVMDFNMNYWRGITNLAEYTLRVNMIGDEFDIAGIFPYDNHVTPLSSIEMYVVASGTNKPASVRVNGSNASHFYGRWNKTVSLAQGTNELTVVAFGTSGERVTQTVTYIRHDTGSPSVGKEALLFPYPGAELVLDEQIQVKWIRPRITDVADGNNCTITRMSVVTAEDGQEVELIGENIPNSGLKTWTPSSIPAVPDEEYLIRFEVSDTSGNTTNRFFTRNTFTAIPEPGFAIITAIIIILALKRRIEK